MKNILLLSFFFCLTALSGFCQPLPCVSELSLEEKIGQLLLVHFHGDEANEAAKKLIHRAHVGGFVYYRWSNGLNDPLQVQLLSKSLQREATFNEKPIPLLLVVDQEGGPIAQLKRGFTLYPSNYAIAKAGRLSWARESAFFTGQQLRAAGINMNLAPVVDVNVNPDNPVIGVRSYGSSPEIVVGFAEEALKGYHQAGMAYCLKHFPGHGDVCIDSHENLPRIYKSLEELRKIELFPFKALHTQADVIMTAHLLIPALDADHCVTLSKKIVTGILRKNIGFQGLIMTDSLAMGGILHECESIEEVAISSFEAGHDLILLAGGGTLFGQNKGQEQTVDDVLRVHQALVQAVQTGRLDEAKIDESVERILKLKARQQLEQTPFFSLKDIAEHQQLARDIAENSVEMIVQKIALPLDFKSSKVGIIAPRIVEDEINMASLFEIGKETKILFLNGLNPDAKECQFAAEISSWADIVIFCSYNGWKNKDQILLANELCKSGKTMISLVLRDPQDADFLSQSSVIICTYSPVPASIEAALKLIDF